MGWLGLLYGSTTFLRIAGHFAILIFAARQRGRFPRASFWVMIGVSLLLVADVGSLVFQIVAARLVGPSSVALLFGMIGLGGTLLSLAAVTLIVIAAFGNEEQLEDQTTEFSPNPASPPSPSGNPYESPQ